VGEELISENPAVGLGWVAVEIYGVPEDMP
jgi:hypothetical protein